MEQKNQRYRRFGKRVIDLVLTVPTCYFLAPIMALLAVVVRVKLGRPVLFRQLRPGWCGKPFAIYKFRTMTDARNEQGCLLPDAERLTSFGKLLRRLSLDELPELFNVVRGDMSLVGPRPLLIEYLGRYTLKQARRHEVHPGITGWAQVNGRNELSWEEKFRLDVWYVDNVSFRLDMKILAMTAWKVIKGEGVNRTGSATMSEFLGKDSDD